MKQFKLIKKVVVNKNQNFSFITTDYQVTNMYLVRSK